MGKTRHAKEDEYYKSIIRKQKSELRKAQQRIKQLERELNYKQNETITHKTKEKTETNICKNCGKGKMKLLDIGIRLYAICETCKFRDRIS